MRPRPSLILLGAVFLPAALTAGPFEGTLAVTVSSSAHTGAQTFQMSVREGFMRVSLPQGAVISDFKGGQVIILMPEQHMYMVRPIPALPSNPAPAGATAPSNLTQTGIRETILGYSCTEYTAAEKDGTSQIWVTDQLGTFGGLPSGGPGQRPQVAPAWEKALKGNGFFPLRVVTTRAGKEVFRYEVTSVEKKTLPDSDFAAPEGWQKLDLGALMGAGMQGGYGGQKPPGSD